MRYDIPDTESTERGRTLKTLLYPPADTLRRLPSTTFTAKAGDRLDLIADRFYGDASLWWAVARANGLEGDSLHVEGGTRLTIPRSEADVVDALRQANR